MSSPILAYLDAGTGAAIAAVVASGAVGARAVFANATGRFRRGGRKADGVDADATVESSGDAAGGGRDGR